MVYNGDKARKYNLARVTARRTFWIEKLGGKCVKCGSAEQLEFDHIDPNTKTFQPTSLWTRREEIVVAELAKCQILCNTCHRSKSAAEKRKVRPHGLLKYKKENCRCDICRSAKAVENSLRRRGRVDNRPSAKRDTPVQFRSSPPSPASGYPRVF